MTNISHSMLDCARAARPWLGESVRALRAFVLSRMDSSGGFLNRAGDVDLYYTMFGLDCLVALSVRTEKESHLRAYLLNAVETEELDLLHLAALARCWSRLDDPAARGVGGRTDRLGGDLLRCREIVAGRVAGCRAPDGGYALMPGAQCGSIYGCFLAVSALLDIGYTVRADADGILNCVAERMRDDGVCVDVPGASPTLNAAAGAILLQRVLGAAPRDRTLCWIEERYCREGGFLAGPDAPMPDLVSTSTALFTLRMAGRRLDAFRSGCREFVAGHWDPSGGFCGHWMDDTPDCEHTFDALLALGCLES